MSEALFGFLGVILGAIISGTFGFRRFREEQRDQRAKERREAIYAVQDALYHAFDHLQDWIGLVQHDDEDAWREAFRVRANGNRFNTLNQRLRNPATAALADLYAEHVSAAYEAVQKSRFDKLPATMEAALEAHRAINDELMRMVALLPLDPEPGWRLKRPRKPGNRSNTTR